MDDSKKPDDIDDHHNFHGYTHKDELIGSQNDFLANLMKHSLLLGADKLLMARQPGQFALSDFESQLNNEAKNTFKKSTIKGSKQNKRGTGLRHKMYTTSPPVLVDPNIEYYQPLKSCNEFPLNLITFLTVLLLKLASFQICLFLRFFSIPIWFFNFCLMFMIFPFQTLTQIRDRMKKKLMRTCKTSYLRLISLVRDRLKSNKSVLKLAVRLSRASFCAAYVFFVLVGLLILGFAIGGMLVRNIVEESIHKNEPLNFDYTKTSPVAVVPITSSLGANHKLQLTVSLTLPESEYNRKLGVFQVRVESLSTTGKVLLGSSHPTMLRFKSKPIRIIETLFNGLPLMAGLKSEVQTLQIAMGGFNEGIYEPTESFKVILEQRAEFKNGSGVPEIYAASLEIASELPQLKRVLWSWRRTVFVWAGFGTFMGEMMVFLLFCKGVVFPMERSKAVRISIKKSCPD